MALVLFVRQAPRHFRYRDLGELLRQLHQIDIATTILPLADVDELQLGPTGLTRHGGHHYTAAAFSQLAQRLSPGLSILVPEIAGVRRTATDAREMYSFRKAIEVFNSVVDLRYSALTRMRVLRNQHAKLVEGLLGPKHKFLNNRILCERAVELAASASPPIVFHSASLLGRRLVLRFRGEDPLFTLGSPSVDYFTLYYLSNSETSGASVRGSMGLISRVGSSIDLFRKRRGRVAHAGKSFDKRLARMLGGVFDPQPPAAAWQAALVKLQQSSLNCGEDEPARSKRQRDLVHAFYHKGIQKWFVRQVVQQAMYAGWRNEVPSGGDPRPDFRSRTCYDVYGTLLTAARRLSLDRREKAEQAAHDILLGRIQL